MDEIEAALDAFNEAVHRRTKAQKSGDRAAGGRIKGRVSASTRRTWENPGRVATKDRRCFKTSLAAGT